jgi:hypothetical protein
MHKFNPVGVASRDAAAKGAVFSTAEGEGLVPIWRAKEANKKAGKAIDFEALQAWFVPRLQAWKADPSQVVTVAEVAAVMAAEGTWVQASPLTRGKPEKLVTLERAAAT